MFIAIAIKDNEYMYRRSTRLEVSKKSGKKIADILTKANYKLNNNEVWHFYDNDNEEIMQGKASIRKGKITVRYY